MRVYEEYANAAEKRQAQRGAKRGRPTGKARGYCIVFDENGMFGSPPQYDSVSGVYHTEPGEINTAVASCGVGLNWLRTCARRVGAAYLPKAWKAVYQQYREM